MTKPPPLLHRPDHQGDRIWATDAGTAASPCLVEPESASSSFGAPPSACT
ncbi:hypothetical protein M6B38_402650 [Iris pallida]|uniref:Uncharacterized protein n=1 Tax=Iris pallida TaxID=29817 RepID=A0AAX6FTB2_IRIPA|nr:hypothetical protein M6B38_402650 [Iris pallida]